MRGLFSHPIRLFLTYLVKRLGPLVTIWLSNSVSKKYVIHVHVTIMTTADNNKIPKLFALLFFYILTEVFRDMNSVDDVMQVISIGLIVAVFLLNTSRYLIAIELSEE